MPQQTTSLMRSTTSVASSGHELSGLAAPELQNLTPHDIDIINAVIERAGPSATTFFSVFKAYSDVLKERGLDPQEVVFYGKLLKLGTLKGKNWGEKWEMVKEQAANPRPISPTEETSSSEGEHLPLRQRRPLTTQARQLARQLIVTPSEKSTPFFHPEQDSSYSRRPSWSQPNNLRKTGIFDAKEEYLSSTFVHKAKAKLLSSTGTSEEDGEISSPVPPSYKSTLVESTLPTPLQPSKLERGRTSQADALFKAKKIITASKERAKAVVDLDDAWKNIRMEQDEKYADEFRDNMLLGRCWDIWRQGYLWINTTHAQIQEARDKLLLRLSMQKWKARMTSQRVREDELVSQFAMRQLKPALAMWRSKLKKKRQATWRQDMRRKMKLVKQKTDVRIKRDAWTAWQRLLLLHRAHRHYEIGLLYRYLSRWKEKQAHLESLREVAVSLAQNADTRILDRAWYQWKQATMLQRQEAIVAHRVNYRILADALDVWRKRVAFVETANIFYDKQLLKRAFTRWKATQFSVKSLEIRAAKHVSRQDDSLSRAVIRIWRARMRGARLERFRETMIVKNALRKWNYRLAQQGAQLDVAQNFLNRTSVRLAASAFRGWQQVLTTHRNAAAYAAKYDEAHVQVRSMLAWRLRLHDRLQSNKVARWADRYFATRRAWQTLIRIAEERKRQRKLREFELVRLARAFKAWRRRTSQIQHFRQCEYIFQERVEKRILHGLLDRWTNRVIELKSRELDVAHQADTALQRAAWQKWKNSRRRHVEADSLLENYLLVKREDILRRAFYRWSTVKRAVEHRRTTHQRKESQLRQILITSAWEKWRENFKEVRLRPLEYQVIVDNQRLVLQRAFHVWLLKTDALPAIRFHSRHLKEKFFAQWKDAIPNALRAKKARGMDKQNTLARYFQQWRQLYKTKTTLKAVARAKSLRLPVLSARQLSTSSRARPLYSGANVFPRRRSPSPADEGSDVGDNDVVVPIRRPILSRAPIVSKTRSERSVPRSDYTPSAARQSSPVRSIVSMPDRRSRSPASRRGPPSTADTVAESDRLWDAIRKVGQARRPRNL